MHGRIGGHSGGGWKELVKKAGRAVEESDLIRRWWGDFCSKRIKEGTFNPQTAQNGEGVAWKSGWSNRRCIKQVGPLFSRERRPMEGVPASARGFYLTDLKDFVGK